MCLCAKAGAEDLLHNQRKRASAFNRFDPLSISKAKGAVKKVLKEAGCAEGAACKIFLEKRLVPVEEPAVL